MKNKHPLNWLARIFVLGDLLEFIYCGLLIGVMIWTASVWRWSVASLIIVEVAFVTVMLIGYFRFVNKVKRSRKND